MTTRRARRLSYSVATRTGEIVRRARGPLALCLALVACAGTAPFPTTAPAARLPAASGLERAILPGIGFQHVVYATPASGAGRASRLFVFIDGDGTPWIHGGREIAADPTPRHPLALELAQATRGADVLYVGRPCYFGRARLDGCRPDDWTFGRYSAAIVASLVAVTNGYAQAHGYHELVLVGYSGGGALAALMAPAVANLRALVTIGADLDTDAWTTAHGYLSLRDSLNPADSGALPPSVLQWHLVGERDGTVPAATIARYLERHPEAGVLRVPRFDHVCCWRDAWPGLQRKLALALADPR